jgi:hypothetical protein
MSESGLIEQPDAAQAEIWALELDIYKHRAQGNLSPYIDNIADNFLAWPPFRERPAGADGLAELEKALRIDNKEILQAVFVAFSRLGDTAVYYRTHRTRRPDGAAVDERFDVVHVWTMVEGKWRVLGGMARDTVFPPPD